MSNRLQGFLQNLPRYVEDDATAQFTTNDPGKKPGTRSTACRVCWEAQEKVRKVNQTACRELGQSRPF